MKIFNLIQDDNYYFATCVKITKNKSDAYDLMMDTALKIAEKEYKLAHPKSLFYTIALRDYINKPDNTYELEDFRLEDKDFGRYNKDIIDCALALSDMKPRTKREFVTTNIFKLYLEHGSAQKVADATNIKRRTVNHHVLKFKEYAIRHCSMYT